MSNICLLNVFVLRMFIEHCDDQLGGEAEEVWQEVEEEKPCEETLEENTGGLRQ